MGNSQWNRTWTLFHAALELEPERRDVFLDAECGTDKVLRAEVAELLRNAIATGVLDRSPANVVALPSDTESLEGKKIGHYVVRSRIGHGGMGIVYDAEQQSPVQRRVALKVIPASTHADAA